MVADLTPEQRRLIQLIFDVFREYRRWPVFQYLDRVAYQRLGIEAAQHLSAIPEQYLWPTHLGGSVIGADQEVALTLDGLASCAGSSALVESFLLLVDWCASREATFTPTDPAGLEHAQVTAAEFASAYLDRSLVATELELLGCVLRREGLIFVSAGDLESDHWQMMLNPKVRRFRGVRSLDDYQARKQGLSEMRAIDPSEEQAAARQPDFFICHASEDKEKVARPLQLELARRGYTVWLDETELTVGDSLQGKIDEGLRDCRFGVVILSRHFFEKEWTKYELQGLHTRQMSGTKVILPVWHEVDQAFVAKYSPSLAGYLAANTSVGFRLLADELIRGTRHRGAQLLRDDSAGKPPGASAAEDPSHFDSKPAGWEYLQFARDLVEAARPLAHRYLAFRQGVAHPIGRRVTGLDDLSSIVSGELDTAERAVSNVNSLYSPEFIEATFGAPSEAGDPTRITFLAHETVAIYETLLGVVERLRGLNVAVEWRNLVDRHAGLFTLAIEQLHDYVALWERTAAQLLALISQQGSNNATPMVLQMSLTISVDEQDSAALSAEWKAIRRKRRQLHTR